jgi:hypothetical protein
LNSDFKIKIFYYEPKNSNKTSGFMSSWCPRPA